MYVFESCECNNNRLRVPVSKESQQEHVSFWCVKILGFSKTVFLFGVPEIRMRILIFSHSDPFHQIWTRHELHESCHTLYVVTKRNQNAHSDFLENQNAHHARTQCVANQNFFLFGAYEIRTCFFLCVGKIRMRITRAHAFNRVRTTAIGWIWCIGIQKPFYFDV